jgi:hypothetical protein
VSRLSIIRANLDFSQPYGFSRPVTGITLPFLTHKDEIHFVSSLLLEALRRNTLWTKQTSGSVSGGDWKGFSYSVASVTQRNYFPMKLLSHYTNKYYHLHPYLAMQVSIFKWSSSVSTCSQEVFLKLLTMINHLVCMYVCMYV